ncbi:MAG: hypothetical protein H7A51_18115 [Akkermansiaceae bacterium]|nr:hypothetical protein [Akkermansiaceae bacterium]
MKTTLDTPPSTTRIRRCAGSLTTCLALGLLLLPVGGASAAKKVTGFDPGKHGFNFSNSFNNDAVKEIDLRTGGLCGGMVYAALDYYHDRARSIPRQDFKPANRTTLQSYIYGRQMDSLGPNLTKWAEVGINPGGARDREFFRWGLTTELANLRAMIDGGQPAPLGIKGHGRGDHQILAIGYDQGSGRTSDLRIYVYDPNFPNQTQVLMADENRALFYYQGRPSHLWRTYFVDKSYRPKTAPSIGTPNYPDDGILRELVVEFCTGEDDLRGGRDNVNMTLHLRNGTRMTMPNVNCGARWLSNYDEFAQVRLLSPVRKVDIAAIEFTTTFGGGIGGDNWDTDRIVVWNNLGATRRMIVQHSGKFRFTGDRKSLRLMMPTVAPAKTVIPPCAANATRAVRVKIRP